MLVLPGIALVLPGILASLIGGKPKHFFCAPYLYVRLLAACCRLAHIGLRDGYVQVKPFALSQQELHAQPQTPCCSAFKWFQLRFNRHTAEEVFRKCRVPQ